MAISANAVWEVRSTATAGNVNGGFFVTGATGTDYSQQNAAQYALTGLTTAGAGAVIDYASASADMVGNGIKIISGTNFTAGWYQITSIVANTSITVDRSCCTGAGASGVANIGGAISLQHASDQTFFNTPTAGNTIYIKSGTYTLGAVISSTVTGTQSNPYRITGYYQTRGDSPTTKATQPNLIGPFYSGEVFQFWRNICLIASSGNTGIDGGGILYQCTVINKDTAPNVAVYCAFNSSIIGCDISCYRGTGINPNADQIYVAYNYIHHCVNGVVTGTTAGSSFIGNIFESISTTAISVTASVSGPIAFTNNTFYGAASKFGTGISYANATSRQQMILNNIFYGLTTAVNLSATTNCNLIDANNFYNCTTDVTNGTKNLLNVALDPGFTGVAEYTGTTATTAGGVLTDSGANFANVVDGRDYLYIVSGTGVTVGFYGISSHTSTTITPDLAPGNNATADKVYKIIYGHDYKVGTNMKAVGWPGTFPGGYTTNYLDIGAAQRVEPTGGGGGRSNNHLGIGRLG